MAAMLLMTCALIALTSQTTARAETVYRCGPALNQYSSTPCEQGRAVEVHDARSAEQLQQGHEAARRHQRAEHDLSRDLKAEERRPVSAVSLSARSSSEHVDPPKHATKKMKRKSPRSSAGTDTFTAIDPSGVQTKRPAKPTRRSN
ncbi:hypothetical protein [Aquabacterium sp.]|uniref:hypothetical protein n=1 Tax=Aquabacterium sp. TaxID=1872578 RepID=UPI0035B1A307